ncbi:MAG TPA: hypothetical protein GX692_00930 [Acholeplasmataceae bacterium]|jgi:hypothetical protein|nr:hypothetical protein [Acholeplasmataceae bacterium]
MKKFFVFLLLLVSAFVFMGCDDTEGPSGQTEDKGKTLVIYCWNEENFDRIIGS